MIGHVGSADRAEVDRIELLQFLAAIFRHHYAVCLVVIGAPIEALDLKTKAAVPLRKSIENLEAGSDDFLADPVGGNSGDLVFTHGTSP